MSYPFADPPTESTLPPLRIHHFMLWTAVTAVMMTVANTDTPAQRFSEQMNAAGIPGTLIGSMCLTGLILGLYWKRQGCLFFNEPGQMAFILHSISTIYGLISTTITAYLINENTGTNGGQALSMLLGFGGLAVGIVTLVLYFKYANKFKHRGKWGKFFKVAAILTLLQFILSIAVSFLFVLFMGVTDFKLILLAQVTVPFVLGIVELVYWVWAVREDLQEQTVYHWTHWVGASTWPLLRLAGLFTIIMLFLFPPDWSAL